MACEEERTRLIGQIASLLREGSMPDEARSAGLTLIGWLARRLPGEPVSMAGVEEMLKRCAERGYGVTSNGTSSPMNGASSPLNGRGQARSKTTNGSKKTNGASSPAANPSGTKQSSGDKRSAPSRSNGRRAR